LNQQRLEARVGKVINLGVHRLYGYRLVFNAGNQEHGGPYANLHPVKGYSRNEFVEGVVYQMTSRQIKMLDVFEGAPSFYTRFIEYYKGKDLQVYIAIQPHYIDKITSQTVQADYLRHILKGAIDNNIKSTIETLTDLYPIQVDFLNKK
jgi:hypothetical protein